MKYVNLCGKQIPSIAMGTWSWGTGINGGNKVFGNNYNEEDLKPVFMKAVQGGLTLWDTAAVYGMGASETILGSLIKDKSNVIISTKFTPFGIQTKNAMKNSLKKSMQRLNKDFIDIYWIHNSNNVKKWTTEIIPLMKSGIIKHVGVSNHNLEQIKVASQILEKENLKLSAVQNHYSLLYRYSEDTGILDWCHKNNVLFFSYMVLEQGFLTGRFNANNPFKKGTERGKKFNIETLTKVQGLIELLKKIGDKYKAEPAQIAIAWALIKGTVPIIGVTKESHVDSALNSLNINLENTEISALESMANDTGIKTKASWEKCMDC